MLVGYARVSTYDQDTAIQVQERAKVGVRRIFHEKASGVAQRVELERMLYSLRRGDTVVVYKLDRLARSLVGLLRVLERIDAVGACLRSLTEPIDTSTPVGRLMIQLLGSFAEFERSVIIERTKAGVDDARRRGVRFGRPRMIPVEALPRHVADGLNARQIAELYNVDTSSITLWLCRLGLNPRGFSRSKTLHRYAPWAQKNPL